MNSAIRTFKVSVLNQMLPLVREIIALERASMLLEEKSKNDIGILENAQKIAKTVEALEKLLKESKVEEVSPEYLSMDNKDILDKEDIIEMFEKWLETKKDPLIKRLEKNIDSNKDKLKELKKLKQSRRRLFEDCIESICGEGGFLKKEEIQEQYIEEYLLLLTIGNLKMDMLFKDENVTKEFCNLACRKYTENVWKIIKPIEAGRPDYELFKAFFIRE